MAKIGNVGLAIQIRDESVEQLRDYKWIENKWEMEVGSSVSKSVK